MTRLFLWDTDPRVIIFLCIEGVFHIIYFSLCKIRNGVVLELIV